MKRIPIIFYSIFFLYALLGKAQDQIQGEEFEVQNHNVTISGTLFLPDSITSSIPVLVFIPGSSAGTREEFLPFVTPINNVGYGVVIYDKRGTGKSTGDFIKISSTTSDSLIRTRAGDVSKIIDYVGRHRRIDAKKIGVCASSQGTWVASALQEARGDLGFIINCSGGVASVGESDYYDEIMDAGTLTIEAGNNEVRNFSGFLGYDPKAVIQEMELPVLWIYGALDNSHPAFYDLAFLEKLGKPNFRFELLKNVNHNLVDVSTNSFSQELMEIAFDWMASIL